MLRTLGTYVSSTSHEVCIVLWVLTFLAVGSRVCADTVEPRDPDKKTGVYIEDWGLNRYPSLCSTIAFDSAIPPGSPGITYMNHRAVVAHVEIRNSTFDRKSVSLKLYLKTPNGTEYVERGTIPMIPLDPGVSSKHWIAVSPRSRIRGEIETGVWKGKLAIEEGWVFDRKTLDEVEFELFVEDAIQPTLSGELPIHPGINVRYQPGELPQWMNDWSLAFSIIQTGLLAFQAIAKAPLKYSLVRSTTYDYIGTQSALNQAAMYTAEIKIEDTGFQRGRHRIKFRWRNAPRRAVDTQIANSFDRALIVVEIPWRIQIGPLPGSNSWIAPSENGQTRFFYLVHFGVDKLIYPTYTWYEFELALHDSTMNEPYIIQASVALQYGPFQGELSSSYENYSEAPWVYNYERWRKEPESVYWYTITTASDSIRVSPEKTLPWPTEGMLDCVLCIDKSGSMVDDIEAVQEVLDEVLQELNTYASENNISLQLGLVTYTRHDDVSSFGSQWLQAAPLTSDIERIKQSIADIKILGAQAGAGGWEDMYGALLCGMGAKDLLENEELRDKYGQPDGSGNLWDMGWRQGACKICLPIGDEPPSDPDWRKRNLATVVERAINLDPVHMYPIVVQGPIESWLLGTKRAMTNLAGRTGGQVTHVNKAEELPSALVKTVKLAVRRHRNEVWRKEHLPYALYGMALVIGLVVIFAFVGVFIAQFRRQPEQPNQPGT